MLDAAGRSQAGEALTARGLLPVSLVGTEPPDRSTRAMPWADLALGLRLLANLLLAGLPLDRALAAFAESAPEPWRRVLPGVAERVREGASLGAALSEPGSGVPELIGAVVQAGEAGTGAARAMERAAALAESIAGTRAALRQALTYPAILLVAGLASLGFLVVVVLPRFAALLADLGQSPPATTRLVLFGAELARAGLLPAAFVLAVGGVLWRSWTGSATGRSRWHRLLLDVPLIGPARRALATARAAGAAGSLLESGVTLPRALQHAAAASGDAAVASAILSARDAIVQGEVASRALARETALTPNAIRLVQTGEETGRLGAMFLEAARLEQAGAERMVRSTVQFVEPGFILVFGGLIALVATALLQALYAARPG